MKDSVVNGILMARAVAIYKVLKAREKAAQDEFKKKNKVLLSKFEALSKRADTMELETTRAYDTRDNVKIEINNRLVDAGLVAGEKRHPLPPGRRLARNKDHAFEIPSGLFNPAKDSFRGEIRSFLARSKHQEYRDLLDAFNRLEVESALVTEEDEVKALFRAFMAVPAPTV